MEPLPAPSYNPNEISQICKRSADKEDLTCIPGFIPFEAKYVISPRYKIATCSIQKSMSTVMRGIMCYLFNETRFKDAGRQILKETHGVRFCANKNEYTSSNQKRAKFNLTGDWRLLMISRDPVDRFLSGFLDKCIRKPQGAGFCNGCGRNMTCFLITEYDRIKRQIRVNKFPRTFDDQHFFPQTWRCDLDKERHRYNVLRYSSDASGSFLNELLAQLKAQKIPDETLKFIRDQLSEGRTIHSTVDSDARKFLEKRLRGSPFLMEHIVRMFYTDFQYFNYSLPSGFH
ncbi:unnamed protein product, partial [Mesorhabditis belari]|uniref:Carbohydrate sulfotransferase n=1 Tax=Mesorhabditis belari TaxID=2138241 RepID=A0AAF3FIH5_9BILA